MYAFIFTFTFKNAVLRNKIKIESQMRDVTCAQEFNTIMWYDVACVAQNE